MKNKSFQSLLPVFTFVIIGGFLFFINASNVYAASVVQVPKTGNSLLDFFLNPRLLTNPVSGGFEAVFKLLFIGLLQFEKLLLGAAASLFVWIVDVNVFKNVVNGPDIYPVWQKVRDLLNIAFILVLLYSAFCTILQIEKYSYKKILLTLVIMALLVNFSFPITRFIIDTSNVLMYTLINILIPNAGGGLFAKFSDNSQIQYILSLDSSASWQTLIVAVVFLFILAITLLAIALLLVVRMIVLVILIIFSPLAFVGSIISVGGSYSSKWWDNLFRYSFFGPIMIFMLYVASTLMDAAIKTGDPLIKAATTNSTSFNFVASMAFFTVPIVILWMGMGIAQSMSIAGAATVMGGAQKFIGKVGRFAGKAPFKGAWWGMKKTGVPGGVKQAYQDWKKRGPLGSSAVAEREAGIAGRLGVKGAKETDIKRRAEEYKKNDESIASLKEKAANGDVAAGYRLALDADIDAKTYEDLQAHIKDPKIRELLDKKASEKNIDVIVKYKVKQATTPAAKAKAVQDEYGKLDADGWKKQKNLENVIDPAHADYDAYIAANAGSVFNMMHDDARKDVGKNASGNKLNKMRTAAVPFNIP